MLVTKQFFLGDRHIDVGQYVEVVIIGDNFRVTDMYYFQKNVIFVEYVSMLSDMEGFNETWMTDDDGVFGLSVQSLNNT